MKLNIWVKIELVCLIIGLLGAGIALFEIVFGASFSAKAHSLFLAEQPLAIILGVCVVIGMISFLFFIINLLFRRFKFWWLRLIGFVLFYFAFATIGASGI